ncbi:IS66 family insertion sequence element accessory protein TnpA [Virgibacillus proomii]
MCRTTLVNKRIEWKESYDAWKESVMSAVAWCREHKIR